MQQQNSRLWGYGSLEFPELVYKLTCHYHVLGLQIQQSIRFHLRKIWLHLDYS